jgi:uncharacterized protein (DUF1778 family)
MKGQIAMTSIKIVLSEDRKKRIKKASVDAGKTLSRYVLDMVDPLNKDTVRNELTAVEEQLNRYGGRMSYEERTALKIRRSELRKELGL